MQIVFIIAVECQSFALWCRSYISSCHGFLPIIFMRHTQSRNTVGLLVWEHTYYMRPLFLAPWHHSPEHKERTNKQFVSFFLFCQRQDPLTWYVCLTQCGFSFRVSYVLSNQCLRVLSSVITRFLALSYWPRRDRLT